MSMELYRNNRDYHCVTNIDWYAALTLAEDFGWTPGITRLDERMLFIQNEKLRADGTVDEEATMARVELEVQRWNGGYRSNDFQIVVEEDALALARAIENALSSIPCTTDTERSNDGTSLEELLDEMERVRSGALRMDDPTPIEQFSGRRDLLERLIDFLKGGEFVIS